MNNIETILIPIKLPNEDGNSKAQIHMKRALFSNAPAQISILWLDFTGNEIEHCYYENLKKDQQKLVDEAITKYDADLVKKSLQIVL